MIVSIEQLRRKFHLASVCKAELEAESRRNDNKLVRYDIWRLQYFTDPYLIGAQEERLADRFRSVFLNVMDLTEDCKLTLRDLGEGVNFLWKFQDIQEEYGLRGGMYLDLIQSARVRILKYIENGGPIAKKIFSEHKNIGKNILVKYGKKEHLVPLFKSGQIRICPASYYSDQSLNEAIRDDEVSRSFLIPTYIERLSGKNNLKFDNINLQIEDCDILIRKTISDYYMFCLSKDIYYRLPTDFDADAALIIHDPVRFEKALTTEFMILNPDFENISGEVMYYDPYRDFGKVRVPELSKQFEYAYQREYRIAFKPKFKIQEIFEPIHMNIRNINEYCTLLLP